jgi:hypothetical protein
MIQLGDFVGQKHPNEDIFLKKGIVVESLKDSYVVQWLTFNKVFWMDFNGEVFAELNKRYLLTQMSYHRKNRNADITVLSKAGKNGVGNP